MTTKKTRKTEKREVKWEDPIVAEVRAVRERLAARFDYDIDRIVDHYVAEQVMRNKERGKGRPGTGQAKAK